MLALQRWEDEGGTSSNKGFSEVVIFTAGSADAPNKLQYGVAPAIEPSQLHKKPTLPPSATRFGRAL